MIVTAEFCQCVARHLNETTGAGGAWDEHALWMLDIQNAVVRALADTVGEAGGVVVQRDEGGRLAIEEAPQ